jgi:hypothetical protein
MRTIYNKKMFDFSFIITSRNDNHGGNMKEKNQFFINRWAYSVKKLDINCELIIVDWNSPKKKLKSSLIIPKLNKNQSIKFIEVPNKIHKKFKNSKNLNIFQMIAKNVGARRAAGKYLILTNVDIIFSKNLLKFLKNKKLDENCIYRTDRYDINFNKFNNYKINEEVLETSITHINKKYYTHDLVKNLKYWSYNSLSGAIINLLKLFFVACVNLVRFLFITIATLFHFILNCLFNKNLFKINKKFIVKKKFFIFLKKIYNIIEFNYLKLNIHYLKLFINSSKLVINIIISPKLHTNACGDFQLISKKTFFNLFGYYEYEGYSFHIDSILMWKAYYLGYKFKELSYKIFHINHTGGYANSKELFKSLKKKDINFISNYKLIKIINNFKKNKNYLDKAKFGLMSYKLKEFSFNKHLKAKYRGVEQSGSSSGS